MSTHKPTRHLQDAPAPRTTTSTPFRPRKDPHTGASWLRFLLSEIALLAAYGSDISGRCGSSVSKGGRRLVGILPFTPLSLEFVFQYF